MGRTTAQREACVPGTFTTLKKDQFLTLYSRGGSVRAVAKAVGVSTVTVFNHARNDPEFRDKYHQAMESNTDALEDVLHEMALQGNVAAVFGILKARRPERWRDNYQARATVVHGFPTSFAAAMKLETEAVVDSPTGN